LFIISLIFFSWKWTLAVFGIRFLLQLFIFYPVAKKLDEKDIYPLFLLFDIWMFFYYLVFSLALIKKPARQWK